MSRSRTLRCQRLVTPTGVLEPGDMTLRDEDITGVGPAGGSAGDVLDGWVVPGFVDTHCHGGGGFDYATTDPDAALAARRFHRAHGTTTTFASLVTAEVEVIMEQIATLTPLVRAGELAGIHLEGPFLSQAKRGAHDAGLLRAPDTDLLRRLLAAGREAVRMITIAPELDGGLAAVEIIAEAGVVVAVGHTAGDESVTVAALDAGARVATHLFNAMPPIHHRNAGPVPVLLTDPRVMVELVCDGFHLHPAVVAMAVAAAGPERVGLVTDAMIAAGMPDGDFSLGSLAVRVRDGQARLVEPDGSPGSIAGSTLTMADAFAFVVRHGCPIPDAAQMAAATPARWHGLDTVGALEPGRRADLCVVGDDGQLARVMQAGRWVEG